MPPGFENVTSKTRCSRTRTPYPSVWVAAFVFGVLVGRMDAICLAAVGFAIAIVVSVGVDTVDISGRPEETFAFNFYGVVQIWRRF